MSNQLAVALIAMLAVKHCLADFVLQTSRHLRFKSRYGHLAGIEHSAIHAALTLPCLWTAGLRPLPMAALAAVELVVHYHVDWLKERTTAYAGWTASDKAFWMAFGADQLAHQLTYAGMVAMVIARPSMLG